MTCGNGLMSRGLELFRVINPVRIRAGDQGQARSCIKHWTLPAALFGNGIPPQERGCFTWFLNKKPYEVIKTSAVSHLEIILLIHFPQVLQNSSTSALDWSVSDWDILKRQIVSSKSSTQAYVSFTWKASVA